MQDNNNVYNPNQNDDEETIDIREFIENVLIYWRWIIVSVVAFLVGGTVYLMTQAPEFESKASILIVDPKSQMNEMSILNELNQMGLSTGTRNATNNEERVLRSTHLMRRVVDELDLHTKYFRKEKLYRQELYLQSPYRVTLDSAGLLHLTGRLELKIDQEEDGYTLEGTYREETFSATTTQLPFTFHTPAGKLRVGKRSQPAATNTATATDKIYVTITHPDRVAEWLSKTGVQTEIDKTSDEIWITFQSNNVQLGKDVLSTLVRLYNLDAVEQITQSAIYSSIFIDGRLTLLEDELAQEEKRIEDYKKSNELTNIDADAALFLENNSQYYKQQTETEIQLQLVSYLQQYIRDPKNKYSLIPDPGLADGSMAHIINEYNSLLISRDKLTQGGSANNPTLQQLNRQLTTMHASITEGMQNLHKSLDIRLKEIEQQNRLLRTRLQAIPRQEREFVEIKRQQQVKESLYVFLLQKREEASLSKAVATNKARLLNAPNSAAQVAPRSALIMAVFFLLGLALPVIVVLLRNLLNTTINSRADVEKLTNLPILAELSHNKTTESLFDHNSNEEPNSELFRLLRAKLQFVLRPPEEKVVLVTSTQPGEGKSFVSVNLAVTLSMMDKKVLLVGLDLRKPTVARIMNIHDKSGITAYLSGMETDVSNLIYRLPEYPNLDVLPAGVIPPNPNELIMKTQFDQLFAELKPQYDYVILDTSPVGAVSDTYLVDRVADLCLYVCRSEYSDKRNIEFINRLHREGTLKRINLVINDVQFESNKYSYYRKYGYGYGYGYGKKKS